MSKFYFEVFRNYYYDKSYVGFNKAKWTKEKSLEQGALELEEKDLSKLEVKEGLLHTRRKKMKAYKIKLNGEVITLKELMELNPHEEILKEALDNGSATHDDLTGDCTVDKIEIIEVDSINGLVNNVHDNAKEHGWWSGEKRTLGELIALMHSELSEALEEHRNEDILKHQNINSNHYYSQNGFKPEGIAVELVDCVIRIMDLFGKEGWNFEEILLEKHSYNKTRPYKHGGKKI